MTGAEKNDIVDFEFVEDIGLGIVVEFVTLCLSILCGNRKNSSNKRKIQIFIMAIKDQIL